MVEYKFNSEDIPNVKGSVEMILAAMITEKGEYVIIDNVITGLAAVEDMADAMGKLVGNIADQTGVGKGFILAVTTAAAAHLVGIEREGEE